MPHRHLMKFISQLNDPSGSGYQNPQIFPNLMHTDQAAKGPKVVLFTTEFDFCRRLTEDSAELYGSNEVLLDYGILAGTFHCSAHIDYTLEKSNAWFNSISKVVDKYLCQPLSLNISSQIKKSLNTTSDGRQGAFQELNSHLTKIFMTAMADNKSDAFDKFEDISALIKGTKFNFKNPLAAAQVNQKKKFAHGSCDHSEKLRELLHGENALVKEKDKSLITSMNPRFNMADITQEIEMLGWAGINFGSSDAYKLQ